jgi:prevent-host-death family protein
MGMKQITATEANRRFSKVLSEVCKGEEYVVTSRGTPVARITPVVAEKERPAEARKKLFERLDSQEPMNIPVTWRRDDIYEDDF